MADGMGCGLAGAHNVGDCTRAETLTSAVIQATFFMVVTL